MKKLLIMALLSIAAASVVAAPPTPWVGQPVSVEIPVMMDIQPVANLDLRGSTIKLEQVDGSVNYVGEADPQPLLTSNVPVTVDATVTPVAPLVAPQASWGVALQGTGWGTNPSVDYDPAYIGISGVGVPVAVLVENPDLTQRPQGTDQRVATVILTVSPRP